MGKEIEVWKGFVSCVLIAALMLCAPFESLAQIPHDRSNVLENGTQMVLRVNENFKADNKADTGTINSVVETDVYSADGTRVLIKAGTPAYIEFSGEPNGAWGKAGKINRYLKSKSKKSVANRLTKCSLRCIFLLASRQRKP